MTTHEQTLLAALSVWAPQHPTDWQDDAYFEPATRRVYTVDGFVEGVHFRRDWMDGFAIGHKCAAAAWSDVAAMGARPLFWMVSLGLPPDMAHTLGDVEHLYRGMMGALAELPALSHPLPALIGGDTVRSPHLTLSITAIGEVAPIHQVGLRCSAEPGDLVVTTGWPGLSALGLKAMANGWTDEYPEAVKAHRYPMPQFQAGLALAALNRRYALMDSSDGLADAVLQMAQASGVTIVLSSGQLTIHPELKAAQRAGRLNAFDTALYGGEDFELVACLPLATLAQLGPHDHCLFKVIGTVERGGAAAAGQTQPHRAFWLDDTTGHRTLLDRQNTYHHFPLSPPDATEGRP